VPVSSYHSARKRSGRPRFSTRRTPTCLRLAITRRSSVRLGCGRAYASSDIADGGGEGARLLRRVRNVGGYRGTFARVDYFRGDRDRVQVVPNVFGGEADELADPQEPDPSLRGECVDEVLRRFEVRGKLVDVPKLAGERFFCHALRLPRPADRLAQPRASATNFVREKCAKGAQPTLVGTPSID